MKYYLLPENFQLKGLHKSKKNNSYFGYKELTQVKFVENSSVHNEEKAIESHKEILLNDYYKVACSLELKKTIKDSVEANLQSGKIAASKCKYIITDPGIRHITYVPIKIKHILSPRHMSSYDMNEFEKHNIHCQNYLQEQVDNFILDIEDAIVLSTNRRKNYAWSGSFWQNSLGVGDYYNKTMILFHQEQIHYKNVMDINTNQSSFTEERFEKLKLWCSSSLDPEQYRIVLGVIAGFNLLHSKDVLMTLLFKNYLSVFKRKLVKAKIYTGGNMPPLFNYEYYTSSDTLISQYTPIDNLLRDYENIIRKRTPNFKVSPEDMKLISEFYYLPNLDYSDNFEFKIQPKQFV